MSDCSTEDDVKQTQTLSVCQSATDVQSGRISCVLCGELLTTCRLVLLPCLHIACNGCLEEFLSRSTAASPNNHVPPTVDNPPKVAAPTIVTCPRCEYKFQLPKNGICGLRDVTFLTSVLAVSLNSGGGERITDDDTVTVNGSRCHVEKALPEDCDHICFDNGSQTTEVATVNNCEVAMVNNYDDVKENSKQEKNSRCSNTEHSGGDTNSKSVVSANRKLTTLTRKDEKVAAVCSENGSSGELENTAGDKSSQIQLTQLVSRASAKQRECELTSKRVDVARQHLDDTKAALQQTIAQRTEYLCQLITRRRDNLLAELNQVHAVCTDAYNRTKEQIVKNGSQLADGAAIANALVMADVDCPDINVDVSKKLNELLTCAESNIPRDFPDITDIRMDIPDVGHEESHLEKLFGTLVRGTIGKTELLTSFHTELRWPSGFVVTRSHDSVLAGKSGAFANDGRVFFYDRQGHRVNSRAFDVSHLPIDVVALSNGRVLVSDVSGRVCKFSSCGQLLCEWPDVFRGSSGHMTIVTNGNEELVLITSSLDLSVHRYRTIDGHRVDTFSLRLDLATDPLEPHTMTTNSSGHIIVTVNNSPIVYIFDSNGKPLHCCCPLGYIHNDDELSQRCVSAEHSKSNNVSRRGSGDEVQMRLPSAVCCDPFDNILVADFMLNCVHLVSGTGQYLGRLLTAADGIACPTCMTLDQDGRLFVGQYGGDMLVFRYLSCVKRA